MKVGRFGLGFKSVFHMTGKQSKLPIEFRLPFMQVVRHESPDLMKSMKVALNSSFTTGNIKKFAGINDSNQRVTFKCFRLLVLGWLAFEILVDKVQINGYNSW